MKARDLPLNYNAVEVLERNLPQRAEEPAVFSTERNCTFGEISDEVNRVGNALLRWGLKPGDCVGILVLDQAEWATCFFGTIKVGGVALGLNTLLTPIDYALMLHDSRARVLIVHEALLPLVEELRPDLEALELVVVVGDPGSSGAPGFAEWIQDESTELAAVETQKDDICSLNYSSGTTGEPKGIAHAHKDLPLTAVLWGRNVLGLGPRDRTFSGSKLFFTFGLGGNLIFPWYAGASIVLMSGSPRTAKNVLETIDRFRPTILFHAPTGYAAILAVEKLEERYEFSSLRLCVSAGEALPEPLWTRWKEATGVDIIDGIGSTENFHIFLSNRSDDIRPGSSGKPVEGYEVKIVDDEGEPVSDGEVGNLWVKGETASVGYLNRPEETARVFRDGWLVTGDKYHRDEDGYYWHAGRSDDMLKVGGIWVSPVEVESTLLSHPAVLECAVVGDEDSAGLIKPRAFVVLRPGQGAGEELTAELVQHCAENMASYKRPRWIEFVEELPKTATGKTQRFRLRG